MVAKIKGRNIKKNDISQTIDISKYLGDNARPRHIQEFGQAIVDEIINRTEKGKDVKGEPFKGYSQEYIDSEDFKEFGKSKNKINLTLTGGMLDSVDFTDDGTAIKVALDSDENPKAFNLSTADTYKDKSKARDFFGVTHKELSKIAKTIEVPEEEQASESINIADIFAAESQTPEEVFSSLFKDLGFFDGES